MHSSHRQLNNIRPLLHRLDLNLLLVFDALYRHCSVSTVASELAISTSTFSHALGRLRQGLDDELFLRQGNRMQPTQRTKHLTAAVAAALHALGEGLEEWWPFVPGQSQRTFVSTATDYIAFALLPSLMNRLQHNALGVRLHLVSAEHKLSVEVLASKRIDFALGYDEEHERLPEGIQTHDWFADRYVVVARRDHPRLAEAPMLDGYLAGRHVVVTPRNEDSGVIDRLLTRSGLCREVAVQLPTMLAALFLVDSTGFLLTTLRHVTQVLAEAANLALYPVPFDIPPYVPRLYSHAQHVGRGAHARMIGQLKDLDVSRTS